MSFKPLNILLGIAIIVLAGFFVMPRLNLGGTKIDVAPRNGDVLGESDENSTSTATSSPTSNPVVRPNEPAPKPDPKPTPTSTSPVVVPKEIVYGDTSKRQVIFTFDGGAGNQSIDEIIATLDKHGVDATFFVTGKWAEQNSGYIRTLAAKGHEVWNHTYSHPDLTTVSETQIRAEFKRTEEIIKNLTGKTSKPYFRPPYGARNSTVLKVAAEEGYRSVYWSTDALDWKPGISDMEVKSRIYNGLQPGAIIMMHIGDDITGRILDEVLTEIKSRGYGIVTLGAGI